MKSLFKKIVFILIVIAVVLHLTILGINALLNWQGNQQKQKKNQKDYQEQEREDTRAARDKAELEKLKKDLEGFSGQGLYKVHDLDVELGYLGIKGVDEAKRTQNLDTGKCEEGLNETGYLLFSNETKKHFCQIIKDIDDWINDGQKLQDELESNDKDNYSSYLVRNNCILYGAPGTGKTEFARELNRILIERYGEVPNISQPSNDPNDPNYGISIDPKEREMAQRGIKKPRIPVVEIKGASLQSAGPTVGDLLPQEKLVKILQKFKEEFYQNSDWEGNTGIASKLPYIVFIEEADQARNTMVDKPKRNLEDFKNFLSSSGDKDGLNTSHISQAAQDRNSIIIIATNNYEEIDPAIKRRGRLGKSLNFTWTPEMLKEYSQGDEEGRYKIDWPKINDEDHYCWKFAKNEDYHLLFDLAKKLNFKNYKERLVNKANNILSIWEDWDEEEKDDFALSRLGLINKVWCEDCQTETNPETARQKEIRIKEKLKNIKDSEEKARILQEETNKKLTTCGHKIRPVCNWLLHFLHTFFVYFEKQNLESFIHPNQIQRYTYDSERLLRERINQLRQDLNEYGQEAINTFGQELRVISNKLTEIHDWQEDSFNNELQNLNNEVSRLANIIENLPISRN